MSNNVNVFKPFISETAKKYVLEVLNSDQIAEGSRVKEFEKNFSLYYGLRCIALNSGTSALEMIYDIIDIKEDDEVIVPIIGHPANALPVIRRKAKVVFGDITDGFLLDPKDVERKITSKTKAVVYVNFGGASDGLEEISDICRKNNLKLIEDAAQSMSKNLYLYGLGDFTIFSLQAVKMLTAGDGGMLYCKNLEDEAKAKRLRWFGFDRELPQNERTITEAGYKYHMNDITAAIGLGNLEELDTPLKQRRVISDIYRLSELPLLVYPWLTILVHEKVKEIEPFLKERNIDCGQFHYRLDKYPIFEKNNCPTMDRLEHQYLLLPVHHKVSVEDVNNIIAYIKHVIN